VQLLANSGVRAAEVLQEPRDSRRDGLTWGDVHLVDDGEDVIHVLGKDQTTNDVAVPSAVRESLLRMRREIDARFGTIPDDWPVFPTRHRPTLSRAARDQLGDDVVDDLLEEIDIVELCVAHEVDVPSLSTNGGRRVMRELCEQAGVDVNGEYLKPHGGRRALGRDISTLSAPPAQIAVDGDDNAQGARAGLPLASTRPPSECRVTVPESRVGARPYLPCHAPPDRALECSDGAHELRGWFSRPSAHGR
jgi:hypothetical protein